MSLNWGEEARLIWCPLLEQGEGMWVSEHTWPSLLGGGMDASWKWASGNGLFFPACLEFDCANPCPRADNSCL